MNGEKQNNFSKTVGTAAEFVADVAKDAYYRVDDLVMGNDTEHNDIWAFRAMALAFTPLPYIHLTIKGGIAAVNGIKSLSEHTRQKIAIAKEKGKGTTNKVLSNEELEAWLKQVDENNNKTL